MVPAVAQPSLHLFVCANRRDLNDPLGAGCGERGEALYQALKGEITRSGEVRQTWVTKTQCLGICPRRGATVARHPSDQAPSVLSEVSLDDVEALLTPPGSPPDWASVDATLGRLETLEAERVLNLARRLRPGLTAEDIRNPHDFPELQDTDWHYADGVLTGIQSAGNALRALRREAEAPAQIAGFEEPEA